FALAQPAPPRSGIPLAQHGAAAQLADAEGELALADPVRRGLADLVPAQREHLAQLLRLAARVDAERAGVGELGGEAVDRVGQPALLPDLLEEPGGHAAAEHGR